MGEIGFFCYGIVAPSKVAPSRAALSSKEVKGFLSATYIIFVQIHIGGHFC